MAANIQTIFHTEVRNIGDFLITPGQGCYIPPYQRSYAWGKEDITRLFEDILIGINQAKESKDKVTFLGTIIAIHDTDYTTMNPVIRSEVPPRVMTIIDGQQRIGTIAMLSIALHNSIYLAQSTLKACLGTKEKEVGEHFSWIIKNSGVLLSVLRSSYATDVIEGEGDCRYYPCIIRAYKDTWSSKRETAEYNSPVARLIRNYIAHESANNVAKFKFQHEAEKEKGWKIVERAFSEVQKNCGLIESDNTQKVFGERINIEEILNDKKLLNDGFWNEIIGYNPPDEIRNYILQGHNQAQNRKEKTAYDCVCRLFRLIVFAFYLHRCVATVIVTMTSEEDAFDMFESLNSTGQPLTAFETFQPKIIEWEELRNYASSPSCKSINRIKEYLDSFSIPETKQKETAEMLVSFALLETGERLAKKLNAQRRYLRKEFHTVTENEDGGGSGGRNFVQSMADTAIFMQRAWAGDAKSNVSSVLDLSSYLQNSRKDKKDQKKILREVEESESIFGLRALHELKHQITIAPLVRFFQCALHETAGDNKIVAIEQFHQSVRATAAFSFLWRGALGGTSGIDDVYRTIMQHGYDDPPLARRPERGAEDPCVQRYKRTLTSLLEKEDIKQKDKWVQKASLVPIYRHSRPVARFLLFCAMDGAAKFLGSKGGIKRGKQDAYPLLKIEHWDDDKYLTLEHVAPQNPSANSDWLKDIYQDIYQDKNVTINLLGNLTLLPMVENSEIKDTRWEEKLERYKSLSNPMQGSGSTKYLKFCSDIVAYDSWSCEIIKSRSKNLAELAWDRLAPWLDLDSES